MMEVGVPGRSPAGQASLPREQEAEPRPADLLLEVRGQGRPSRPHFLQPRPTPCGPRVYGNSGLDGFSEIIRSLCPRLTPRAHRERDPGPASWEMWEGKGTLLRGPRSGLSPKIFFLSWSFTHQARGSASFACIISSWEMGCISQKSKTRPRDFSLDTQLARTTTQFATLASLGLRAAGFLHPKHIVSWFKMWVHDAHSTVGRQWWVRTRFSRRKC